MEDKKLLKTIDGAFDGLVELEKAIMALGLFMDEYDWSVEPTIEKAAEYGRTVGKDKDKDLEAKVSWKLINDYKKITWLVRIAFDYCYIASEKLREIVQ